MVEDFATVGIDIQRDGITVVKIVDSAGRAYCEWRRPTGEVMTLREVDEYRSVPRPSRSGFIRRKLAAFRGWASRRDR